ncbi:MAG: adenine phosphoribosyltransferase [Candidatus Melainabacteria bacterium]|nr:adenine phosphoribosyltransferase [Candidatus Melainabacteria bacterium]
MTTVSHTVQDLSTRLREAIRDIPDYPKPGILFKDITTALRQPQLFADIVEALYQQAKEANIQYVAGIESRGFILGSPLAYRLGAGFIPIRKRGKLPGQTAQYEYQLEYGTDCVEIHVDAIEPGARVLLVDDLLATGGTAAAASHLIGQVGGRLVGALFMVDLAFLNGRSQLPPLDLLEALVTYTD